MKKLVLIITLLFSFLGYSQIFNPVKWSSKIEQKSDNEFVLVMDAALDDEWHMYSQFTPDGGSQPTAFTFKESKGNYQLVGKTKESPYKKVFNDIFEVDEYYFAKKATFKQTIKVTNPKLKTIKVYVEYQVCKEQCIQGDNTFTFTLPEIKTAVVETASNVVTADSSSVALDSSSVVSSEVEKNIKEIAPTSAPKEEKKNGWLLFLATLLAGILVTFTPCVFPMIPMTVSFFLKQSAHGDKKKGRFNALMYGFFIVLIYVLISLPFHIFEGISEDIFYEVSTNPYLNLFFFAVFTIFAISFLGAFEITIPSSLANKVDNASNKGGLIGIFFMALTLIIVSFSCTGPALGLVIGGALSTDGGATLLTIAMLGFGVGLAFPFMIFALFPSMMGNLPKSGGWLNTVKVVFGFIELALAFKFFSMR